MTSFNPYPYCRSNVRIAGTQINFIALHIKGQKIIFFSVAQSRKLLSASGPRILRKNKNRRLVRVVTSQNCRGCYFKKRSLPKQINPYLINIWSVMSFHDRDCWFRQHGEVRRVAKQYVEGIFGDSTISEWLWHSKPPTSFLWGFHKEPFTKIT
jgi:hypothetical protein